MTKPRDTAAPSKHRRGGCKVVRKLDEAQLELRVILEQTARRHDTITYEEAGRAISMKPLAAGDPLLHQLLKWIMEQEYQAGRGMLSAVVVHKGGNQIPGADFFRQACRLKSLASEPDDKHEFWQHEVDRVWDYWATPSLLAGFNGPEHLSDVNEASHGVYAIVLGPGAATRDTVLHSLPLGTVVYVGKAERDTLRARVSATHASSRRTGSSTFRRTLGAVLRSKLRLEPRPRADGDADHYRFDPRGEGALSDWIEDNLLVYSLPLPKHLVRDKEDDLITRYEPVLNLSQCTTTLTPVIEALRQECKTLAATVQG